MMLGVSVLQVLLATSTCSAWILQPRHYLFHPLPSSHVVPGKSFLTCRNAKTGDFVDAEFERSDEIEGQTEPRTAFSSPQIEDDLEKQHKSLMEMSREGDPEIANTRIPFFDGEDIIDVRLSFMADVDGVSYGIGVPFDHPVAIVVEEKGEVTRFLSPDDDENEELMQLMAAQLHDHLGEDLQLIRTPRVLTIDGPLENYTKDWRESILPRPFTMEELFEDDGMDLDFFHKLMREELGEEEYKKAMSDSDPDIDPELEALFDIPGMGTMEDDEEVMDEFIQSIFKDKDEQMDELETALGVGPDIENTLKLVGYILKGGRSYTLVQLMEPFVIVGRFVKSAHRNQFELLSSEEALIVEPRLAEVCKQDLENAGIRLDARKQ